MEYKGKNVLVVGLGKTGRDVCRFLLDRGARVTISDKRSPSEVGPEAAPWTARGARLEAGGHRAESFLRADLIIPSPGVPPLPELRAARKKGILIWSELELAYRHLQGTVVGISGTNGKSTTTTLTHKILKESGARAFLGGNIGKPLISFVERSRPDHIYVTEISSFQLYYIDRFHARVAALLNVSLNHLDWHPDFEDYFSTKARLITGLGPQDTAILNRDDARVWALRERAATRILGFSRLHRLREGCYLDKGRILMPGDRPRVLMSVRDIPLPGDHNRENIMAAALIGRVMGVPLLNMKNSIRSFAGLEHRLEHTAIIRGVTFINDSKATTVNAALMALRSFSRKTILILGGKDKGDDFTRLRRPLKDRARLVILLGEAGEKIRSAIRDAVPVLEAGSMRQAVRLAFEKASRGDVVLLAPACASFDMFRNYEHRGLVFKQEVRLLARRSGRTA